MRYIRRSLCVTIGLATGLLAASAPASANPDIFRFRVPDGGPNDWIRCPAVYPDTGCDGDISLPEAEDFLLQCAALPGDIDEHTLFNPSDCADVRARKMVAAVEAMAYIANYPGLFTGPGEGLVTLSGGCSGSGPGHVDCAGASGLASALVSRYAGLPLVGTPGATPPANVPPLGPRPSVPLPTLPNPQNPPTNPVAPDLVVSPGGGGPCTPPSPSIQVLPKGDGPQPCLGEVKVNGTGPCAIQLPEPTPSPPDVPICAGDIANCPQTDVPSPGTTDQRPIPPWDLCAGELLSTGGSCAVPTCDALRCDEEPTDGLKPELICAGTCKPPPATPSDITKPEPVRQEPNGIYPAPIAPTPPVKTPMIFCQDTESTPTQSTVLATSSGSRPHTPDSVDAVTGQKLEQDTDVTVSLSGMDFHLVRNYSSDPWSLGQGDHANPGFFGFGWSSPLFQTLHAAGEDESELSLLNARANRQRRFAKVTGSSPTEWRPTGHGTERIIADSEGGDDVFRLLMPGQGEMQFYRGADWRAGKLRLVRDDHGNTQLFEYRRFVATSGGETLRLNRVYLNGTSGADAQGMVQFGYVLAESAADPNNAVNGRVGRVLVYRFRDVEGMRESYETHRIEYTYKRDGDGLSSDLGTAGDLIQVTKFSRVDAAASDTIEGRQFGPDYPHRVSITQYRYFAGQGPAALPPNGDPDERLQLIGPVHALKSVLRPAQVESLAELINRDNHIVSGTVMAVRDAGFRMLQMSDSGPGAVVGCNVAVGLLNVASKVVGYADNTAGSRVAVEYVQSPGCGCDASSQDVKHVYTHIPQADGHSVTMVDDTLVRRNSGGTVEWTAYTRRWLDAEVHGAGALYGVNDVLAELTDNGEGPVIGRLWIEHFEYDTLGRLVEAWTPEACRNLNYVPAELGVPAHFVDLNPNGLIRYFEYNGDNRPIEIGTRQAHNGLNEPLMRIEYGVSDTGNVRTHLPTRIERLVDLGSGTPRSEIVTFDYAFRGEPGSNALLAVRSTVDAELPTENGPATGPGTYSTLTLVDAQGRVEWSGAADLTLQHLTYDNATGRVAEVRLNVPVSELLLSSEYDEDAGAWISATGLTPPASGGPTLSYTIDHDLLGRVVRTQTPGPDPSQPVVTQWVYGYARIDQSLENERWGAPFAYAMCLPHRWTEGATVRFSGPAMMVWMDANGAPVQASEFRINPSAAYDRNDPGFFTGLHTLISPQTAQNTSAATRSELSRVVMRRTATGALTSYEAWHDVTGSMNRPTDDRSYRESIEYDELGRALRYISTNGDITKYKRDVLGRVVEVWFGTSESNLVQLASYVYDADENGDPGVGNGNLSIENEYTGEDSGVGVRTTKYRYDHRDRIIAVENPQPPYQFFEYDNLGRLVRAAEFDGSSGVPTSIDSGGRVGYEEYSYNRRGLVYRSAVAIDPANLSAGTLESFRWFDPVGRVIAAMAPDSPGFKARYDALGRVVTTYTTDRGSDVAPGSGSYEDAASVVGDSVLEQTEYTYSDQGYLSLVKHLVARHDLAPGWGPLTVGASGSENEGTGIASWMGYRYDPAGRPVRTVDFGTNNAPSVNPDGDAFRNGPAPAWNPGPNDPLPEPGTQAFEHCLVSGVTYDERGLAEDAIDPEGHITRTLYDDLSRVIATVENWSGNGVTVSWDRDKGRWDVTGLDRDKADQNRTTTYAHARIAEDLPGGGQEFTWRVRQTAHLAPRTYGSTQADAQVTELVYGAGATHFAGSRSSLVEALGLPREVRFPDEDNGEPGVLDKYKVKYAYNRLGELIAATDQNGTTHRYFHDALGRMTQDLVEGSQTAGVDLTVKAIGVEFDGRGQLTDVRSMKDNGSGGLSVRDHVRYAYSPLGLLTTLTQDPDSDVDATGPGAGEPPREIVYSYATSGAGIGTRLMSMRYPEVPGVQPTARTSVTFSYGNGGATDPNGLIGRVTGLSLGEVTTIPDTVNYPPGPSQTLVNFIPLADYTYLGLDSFAQVNLAPIETQLDRTIDRYGRRNFGVVPQLNTQTVGTYPGFDRFGRIKRHAWVHEDYNEKKDTDGIGLGVPNRREYSNFSYAYDRVGNPIARRNDQQGAGFGGRWADRDWKYKYDGLNRLVQAQRGAFKVDNLEGAAGAFTNSALPEFTQSNGSRTWDLDELGNWRKYGVDFDNSLPDANGNPTLGTDELQDRGDHNLANELGRLPKMSSTLAAGTPYAAEGSDYGYDDNGNRIASGWNGTAAAPIDTAGAAVGVTGLRFRYTYDAWNRLVEIKRACATASGEPGDNDYKPIARYSYNALNWRTIKETVGSRGTLPDVPIEDPDDPEDFHPQLTEKRWIWYDAAWRAVAEDVDEDVGSSAPGNVDGIPTVPGIDRHIQQFFGLRGVNDAIHRREDRCTYHAAVVDDPNTPEDETQAAFTDPPDGHYGGGERGTDADLSIFQLSDPQFSVVSVLKRRAASAIPRVVDEVEFDPYGVARWTAQGDFLRDANVGPGDITAFMQAYFTPDLAADENDDGVVSLQDIFDFLAENLAQDPTPTDRISSRIIDNPYGYCGYMADGETAAAKLLGPKGGALYSVRFRTYDPIAGRWLTRDPAGFVDGMNLYEYCTSGSVGCFDPAGLAGTCDYFQEDRGAPDDVDRPIGDRIDGAIDRVRSIGHGLYVRARDTVFPTRDQYLRQVLLGPMDPTPVVEAGEGLLDLLRRAYRAAVGEDPVSGNELTPSEQRREQGGLAVDGAVYFLLKKVLGSGTTAREATTLAADGSAEELIIANPTVKWVDEPASMDPKARAYNSSVSGARSNPNTRKPQAPSIEGETGPVRFDGEQPGELIDRKRAVVTSQKAKSQALRQWVALRINGLRGTWEVPNAAQAARAQKMLNKLGIDNIDVKVVPE